MSHFSKENALSPQAKKNKNKKVHFNYFSSLGLTLSDIIHTGHNTTKLNIQPLQVSTQSGPLWVLVTTTPFHFSAKEVQEHFMSWRVAPPKNHPIPSFQEATPRLSPFSSATSSSPSILSLPWQSSFCMHTVRGHNIGSLERFIQQKYFIWPEHYYWCCFSIEAFKD